MAVDGAELPILDRRLLGLLQLLDDVLQQRQSAPAELLIAADASVDVLRLDWPIVGAGQLHTGQIGQGLSQNPLNGPQDLRCIGIMPKLFAAGAT